MSLLDPPSVTPADFGKKADARATSDDGTFSFISLFKRGLSQASGWEDDGSESGVTRVKVSRGNLVAVPFRTNNCAIQPSGTATAFLNAANTGNFDGTSTGVFCSIPGSAALGNGVRIAFWFNGPALALRYSASGGNALPPMSMQVDGVAYAVPQAQNFDAITNTAYANGLAEMQYALISDNLGDGPHFAEVFLQQSATAGVAYLHGYMAAESAGYQRPQPGIKCGPGQIALSAAYAGIQSGNSSLSAVRKLFFYNPTAGAVVVSVKSISTATNPFWERSVPVGDTLELDLGGLCYDLPSIQAKGNGVICSMTGAQ